VFTEDIIDEIVDVGAVSVKGASLGAFAGTVSAPRVDDNLLTSSTPVTLWLA
jgi:hypothetical protein